MDELTLAFQTVVDSIDRYDQAYQKDGDKIARLHKEITEDILFNMIEEVKELLGRNVLAWCSDSCQGLNCVQCNLNETEKISITQRIGANLPVKLPGSTRYALQCLSHIVTATWGVGNFTLIKGRVRRMSYYYRRIVYLMIFQKYFVSAFGKNFDIASNVHRLRELSDILDRYWFTDIKADSLQCLYAKYRRVLYSSVSFPENLGRFVVYYVRDF